ncbi:MAG: flagellar protein FlgN [Thermodesulfobacteria bacterium]|nr:flagellar protein FlgN [Thermodesulfobacteriota bacterium]
MVRKELLELKEVLEEEKKALMHGAVEEILKWASYKARLANFLKDKNLTPEEKELLKEIAEINERNKMIIEAGLSFVEEAYKFLTQMLYNKDNYGDNKNVSTGPQVLSKTA